MKINMADENNMNIIYYGKYSTTDGKEYRIGYEEGNTDTANVIVEEIEDNEERGE